MSEQPLVTRRTLLAAGAATAGVAVVAGCGSGGSSAEPTTSSSSPTADQTAPASATPLIAVADVPVGGAASATDADGNPVIVSQPTAGQIVAFSAICTHRGCTVAPDGAQLRCPCHGSVYDAFTGEVIHDPAPSPLPEVAVVVKKGEVVEA